MRRFSMSVSSMALLTALVAGCGSSTNDEGRLVMRFVQFNGVGLMQADNVTPNSANVDVVPTICAVDQQGLPTAFETFTETLINAVFLNEQKSDILLDSVTIDAGPNTGLGVIEQTIAANLPGGKCSQNSDQSCATDADCFLGVCQHSETTVTGILLFDFQAKAAVLPSVYGQAQNITITFSGNDDRGRTFTVSRGYVVTFDDFNNCSTMAGGQP